MINFSIHIPTLILGIIIGLTIGWWKWAVNGDREDS